VHHGAWAGGFAVHRGKLKRRKLGDRVEADLSGEAPEPAKGATAENRVPVVLLLFPFILSVVSCSGSLWQDGSGAGADVAVDGLVAALHSEDGASPSLPSSPSWFVGAQESIEAREYWASKNAQGLQAPNRAQNLRTYFDAQGIRVEDRTVFGGSGLLQMRLAGVGRGDALTPVAEGEVRSEGSRVEIHRAGLVEWYENSPKGLEQGFTLEERPPGEGELVLELALLGARAT